MKNVKAYFKPETPEEAVRLFQDQPGKVAFIAGGTRVAAAKDPSIEYLVDITYCGLDSIQEQNGQLCIGACTTLGNLVQSEVTQNFAAGLLAEVAAWTGSLQRRNSATVGGNLIRCQDMALPLLSLEAQLVILGNGERTVSLADFYASPTEHLREGELLKECIVSGEFRNARGAAQRLSRTRQDVSIIGVAAVVLQANGTCEKACIAVGPVENGVMRVADAEMLLKGQAVTGEIVHQAAETVAQVVQPLDDFRAGAEYRKKMLGVYTKRALRQCLNI